MLKAFDDLLKGDTSDGQPKPKEMIRRMELKVIKMGIQSHQNIMGIKDRKETLIIICWVEKH